MVATVEDEDSGQANLAFAERASDSGGRRWSTRGVLSCNRFAILASEQDVLEGDVPLQDGIQPHQARRGQLV